MKSAKQAWIDWRPSRYDGYELIAHGISLEFADRLDAEVVEFAEDCHKAMLDSELSRLNAQWDLSDYPKNVEPQNATEANLIYCAYKKLKDSL